MTKDKKRKKNFIRWIRKDMGLSWYAIHCHSFKEIPFPKIKWKHRFIKCRITIEEV